MTTPHFLVIPYPVLGHINPLLQFSQVLAKHGCRITFVLTEFNQKRVKTESNLFGSLIKFVSLPDGLDPDDDRSDHAKIIWSLRTNMPSEIQKLIEEINVLDLDLDGGENSKIKKITCIVVSKYLGWALEVGHKMGIKGALLWPASAISLASFYSIQRLIREGIIDPETGIPTRKQEIELIPNSPMMDTENLPWCGLGKNFFLQIKEDTQTLNLAEWWLCNTTSDLEPGAMALSPKFLPIGPLGAIIESNTSSFWKEDTTCLQWLDQQPPQSVTYVSFGSMAVMESNQFKELALALDLLNKPFLWVVRPGNDNSVSNDYPHEFHGSKGKIVAWAPQKKILNHPSIACFITHCGWNSTIEGVYGGVPFLCWPHFSDQFVNKSYICHVWKVGLGLEKDERGLILKEEIRRKVEQLLGDEDIRARSLKLKEMTMDNLVEGGMSSKNLEKFINWAKG